MLRRPRPNDHGFLRVDPDHPYSFVWDDGTRYFMWGQTYYDLMQDAMVNNNWKTAADKSMAYGMNKIRMRVYAQGGFYGFGNVDHGYPEIVPYAGKAASPNRDNLNLRVLEEAGPGRPIPRFEGDCGRLILLSTYGNATMPGTPEQDERFVKYVLSRYAAYPNVIWDVTNEWASGGKPQVVLQRHWQARCAAAIRGWLTACSCDRCRPIRTRESTSISLALIGRRSLLSNYGPRNDDHLANGDQWGNAGIVKNLGHKMPVVNDEYGYIADQGGVKMTRTQIRQAIWGIATAGGYGSSGDIRIIGSGAKRWTPCKTGEWADAPEYGDLKRMVDFFTANGIEYWKMVSHNELKTAGTRTYVLAEPGRQYVIYAATGGNCSVKLAAGTYDAKRYDPRTGETKDLPAVTGGRVQSFTLPDSNGWVIRLSSQ